MRQQRNAVLTLVQVDADDPRLGRLLQLYIHEWSALVPQPIGEDALFRYGDLSLYRGDDTRAAFLFVDEADRLPLGFGLVERHPDLRWSVEEFFVIAGARRRGAGTRAAQLLFATRPGPWTLTVRLENPGALGFWRRVVPGAGAVAEPGADGVTRTRLSFDW